MLCVETVDTRNHSCPTIVSLPILRSGQVGRSAGESVPDISLVEGGHGMGWNV